MTAWHDGLTEVDARADGVIEVFSEAGVYQGEAVWREETNRWWFSPFGGRRGKRSTAAQSAAAIKAACSREERERR